MRPRTFVIATVIGMLSAMTIAGTAQANHGHHGGRPLRASLSGANEVGAPGDPDGSGGAAVWLNPGHGRICFGIRVSGISLPATAASIQQGAAGATGGVVASLAPPSSMGVSFGCMFTARSTVLAILRSPSSYYVNVLTVDYPGGAIRGQLSGGSGSTPPSSGRSLSANLRGSSEYLLTGDPDGSGKASFVITPDQTMLCFTMHVSAIALPATAAYIQQGAAGVVGPVVVTLTPPETSGSSGGCVGGLSSALTSAIIANPAGYYVNVVTTDYPGGAIRGQLSTCGGDGDHQSDDVRPPTRSNGNGCGDDDDQGDQDLRR